MMNSLQVWLYKVAAIHVQTLCFQSVRMKTAQEKNQHKTLVGLKILSSSCNKCKPMATHLESVCCLNKHEICECYFKGKLLFVFNIFFIKSKGV